MRCVFYLCKLSRLLLVLGLVLWKKHFIGTKPPFIPLNYQCLNEAFVLRTSLAPLECVCPAQIPLDSGVSPPAVGWAEKNITLPGWIDTGWMSYKLFGTRKFGHFLLSGPAGFWVRQFSSHVEFEKKIFFFFFAWFGFVGFGFLWVFLVFVLYVFPFWTGRSRWCKDLLLL